MARKNAKKITRIFQLKIALREIAPTIWRRLLVPANIDLGKLHVVLQLAMGWTNSHLHQFEIRDRLVGDIRANDEGGPEVENERRIDLDQLVAVGQSLVYSYDFGDSWHHEVLVEKELELDERLTLPLCIGGARACPPEDCGGTSGHERLLQILSDSKHDEYDETIRWLGGFWAPESFDPNAVNRALAEQKWNFG